MMSSIMNSPSILNGMNTSDNNFLTQNLKDEGPNLVSNQETSEIKRGSSISICSNKRKIQRNRIVFSSGVRDSIDSG